MHVIAQPGSHEKAYDIETVVKELREEFPNLHDVFTTPRIENEDHHLVFLPGSDWCAGGQYQLTADQDVETGWYMPSAAGLIPVDEAKLEVALP